MLESIDGAQKLSPAPDDSWGLHLIDVNVVLGDLIELVARQTEAYLAPRPIRLALRCTGSALRVGLRDAPATTSVT